MARYNTSAGSTTINGATTISSPNQGAFTNLTGTAPYTVTVPNPVSFPGSNQTFYNATSGTITLSTPSGIFSGTGASGTSTNNMFAGNVLSITSDGTNYVVISEDGSPLIATTGSFSSDVTITGASATVNIQPSSLTLYPGSIGAMDRVAIGVNTRSSGAFTTLAANSQVSFTAGTASSSSTTGSLVVTGGVGVTGNIWSGATINASSVVATGLTGTLQTAAQPNITSIGTLTGLTVNGRLQNAGGLKTYSVQTGQQGNVNAVYEIMKVSRDNVNWSQNTVYEITVYSTYYPGGGYTKYLLSYGYFNDGSLVCTYAGGSGMLRVYLGTEVSVNANCQYKPVFVDLPPYMQCTIEVRYNTTEVLSVGAITSSSQVFFSGIMTASGGTGAFYNGNTHIAPSGGNVGIGTTSPSQKLEVYVSRTSSTNAIALLLNDNVTGGQTDGVYKAIRSASNSGNSVSEIRFVETDGSNNNTAIAFATAPTAGGLTERMRVTQGGNLFVTNGFIPANASRLVVRGTTGGSYNSSFSQSGATVQIIGDEMSVNQWYPTLNIATVRQSLTTGSGAFGGIGFSTIDDSNNAGMYDAARIAVINESGSVVASPTALAFYTQVGSATTTNPATERMRIDSKGVVSILGERQQRPPSTLSTPNTTDNRMGVESVVVAGYQGVSGTVGFSNSDSNPYYIKKFFKMNATNGGTFNQTMVEIDGRGTSFHELWIKITWGTRIQGISDASSAVNERAYGCNKFNGQLINYNINNNWSHIDGNSDTYMDVVVVNSPTAGILLVQFQEAAPTSGSSFIWGYIEICSVETLDQSSIITKFNC